MEGILTKYEFDIGDFVKHRVTGDVGNVTNLRMDDRGVPIITMRCSLRTGYMVCREWELSIN